jgi:TPR repeat protein
MSSLLTIENKLSLWQKLIIADINDVRYNSRLLLSSCCGMKLLLIKLLTKGCPNARRMRHLQILVLQRIIANMPAALYQYALALVSTGQCATAMIHLNRAIIRGHLSSRAIKAWMLLYGREGVAQDCNAAFELAEEGARLGCHHCQGVMAARYLVDFGIRVDTALSLELARKSSGKGSKYGQYVLGGWYHYGFGGVAQDYAQAIALYQLAAAQNLDEAQHQLGFLRYYLARDVVETLRLYQLAAAQGNPGALYCVAQFHENGLGGVCKNKAEAILWYRRALAAGLSHAAVKLKALGAK